MTTLFLLALIPMNQDSMELDSPNNSLVRNWMAKNVEQQGSAVQPVEIRNAVFTDFTKLTFHSVHYREFPMQMVPPKPMATRSLFSVSTKGKVTLLTQRKQLAKFLVGSALPVKKTNLKAVAIGYAQVSTVFSQDGMFQFVFDEKNVGVADSDGHFRVKVVAPVVERSGDTGQLTSILTFSVSKAGGDLRLTKIEETDTIKAGVRPICQCTLLLDDNPIVRKMAERDLLVMGRAARPYVLEQLETASPELKVEIERVWKRILNGDR